MLYWRLGNVELGAEWLEGGDEFLKWAFDKGYLANLTVRPPEEGLFLVQNRPNVKQFFN
jgi:hypothetical protein